MILASPETMREAQAIVDSSTVIGTYAACEWDELTDDGKNWIAAIVQEAQARALTRRTRATMRQGGLRPAPFALSPMLVERALKATGEHPALPVSPTVPAPQPPAAVDGPIEPARHSPMQADPSAPAELSPALGRPDTLGLSGTPCPVVVPISAASLPARISDVRHRQARDRDARSQEIPLDKAPSERRRAVLRDVSGRLGREKIALPPADKIARIAMSGATPAASKAATPAHSPERRRAVLEAAIVFLRGQSIPVTVEDRQAQIRKFWVGGKPHAILSDELIQFAAAHGFEVPA